MERKRANAEALMKRPTAECRVTADRRNITSENQCIYSYLYSKQRDVIQKLVRVATRDLCENRLRARLTHFPTGLC